MAHDVFVSYSSKDKTIADALVAAMEKNSIRCWYAPRDIKSSEDWGKAITAAIEESRVFLVVFSASANRSQRVLDEVNLAISQQAVVLPFRIENLEPEGALKLHLSSRHWLDAYDPSWHSHIKKLVKDVSTNLDVAIEEEEIQVPPSIKRKSSKLVRIVAGIVIGAILITAGWFGFSGLLKKDSSSEQASSSAASEETPIQVEEDAGSGSQAQLGSEQNPIIWTFAIPPNVEFADVNTAADEIVAKFREQYPGMLMKAIPAPSISGAYDAICSSEAHIAYLDGFTYLRKDEDNCKIEARLVWHAHQDIEFGGAIYVSGENKDIQSLAELKGKVLCIPNLQSTSGWTLPSLELRANIGDPYTFFSEVIEIGDHFKVIENLYDGTCDIGTAYYDAREHVDLPNVKEEIEIFLTTITSPMINMSFRTDIDDTLLNLLISFFSTISSEDNNLAKVNGLVDETGSQAQEMIEINDFFFADLRDLLERAGARPSEFESSY